MSEWIKCSERLPELKDDSVLAYADGSAKGDSMVAWLAGGMDMVHIEDYFKDITAGQDPDGTQLYTKWYLTMGVTHWMHLPDPPKDGE